MAAGLAGPAVPLTARTGPFSLRPRSRSLPPVTAPGLQLGVALGEPGVDLLIMLESQRTPGSAELLGPEEECAERGRQHARPGALLYAGDARRVLLLVSGRNRRAGLAALRGRLAAGRQGARAPRGPSVGAQLPSSWGALTQMRAPSRLPAADAVPLCSWRLEAASPPPRRSAHPTLHVRLQRKAPVGPLPHSIVFSVLTSPSWLHLFLFIGLFCVPSF